MSAQTFVALLLVLLAVSSLLGRAFRRARPASDPCGGCSLKAACGGGGCRR